MSTTIFINVAEKQQKTRFWSGFLG